MVEYIIGIILIVLSAWLILISFGLDFPYNIILDGLDWFAVNSFKGFLVAILIFICGFILLKKPRPEKEDTIVSKTSRGELRITKHAMSDMINRSTTGISGIRNVRSKINQTENGLLITVICQLEEGMIIEPISTKIQEKVKEDIELYSSLPVKEVRVLVRSTGFINPAIKR